jgi:hypothetical protein
MRKTLYRTLRRLLLAGPIASILLVSSSPGVATADYRGCLTGQVCIYRGVGFWDGNTATWTYQGSVNVNIDVRSEVAGADRVVYVRNENVTHSILVLITRPDTGENRLYCFRPQSTAAFPTPSNGGVQVNTIYVLSTSNCPP